MRTYPRSAHGFLVLTSLLFLSALSMQAQIAPEGESSLDLLVFGDPDLFISNSYQPIYRDESISAMSAKPQSEVLPAELMRQLRAELHVLETSAGLYDVRTGRWGTLIQSEPLIPGAGVGNTLRWDALKMSAPAADSDLKQAAFAAFRDYLSRFQAELKIRADELDAAPHVAVHESGKIVQINVQRFVQGVPVRNSYLTATLNNGNLVVFGTRNWADMTISTRPALSEQDAIAKVYEYAQADSSARHWRKPHLAIIPLEKGDDLEKISVGQGLRFRLAWVISPVFEGSHGSWEGLVDAETGELLSFSDQNQYLDRKVVGGVYPVSNDKEINPIPPNPAPPGQPIPGVIAGSGTEQAGWPMPFADILLTRPDNTTENLFTNSGGVLSCADGTIKTLLSGKYVRMNDNCGPISESALAGDLDLGVSGGTDCTVPADHSAGDTHASRSGFFEVNRITEMARSWLPNNSWLKQQLTANMNIDLSCNAFWNGSTINFYKKSTGATPRCANTGELAAVFDHEWGHGMDANDANPGISLPGEAPADIYAILRLNDSCVGRGFFLREFCSGTGDRCLSCTGVREADWAKRASGLPHNIDWIISPVATPGIPGVRPPGGCVGAVIGPPPPIPGVTSGPCGQSTHCEGGVVTEVIWDLIHRDLATQHPDLDVNTRLNLVTRLHYLGGGNVFFWFTCSPPNGGCNADSGYLNYLAVDDDDGNIANGTPHMTAIFNAFNRHQMACPTPTAINNGCATKPTAAPTVTVAAVDNGARVSWGAVPNAAKYWVFRTDSLDGQACNYGKERVAITTGTQFLDSNLLNGRKYFYTVEAVGANDSCRSSASSCASVVAGGAAQSAANLGIVPLSTGFTQLSGPGDGDPFLDNCENARISFRVQNTGNGPLTNVRIVRVDPVSHPQITILGTSAAIATLAACGSGQLSFDLQAAGLSFNDNVRFRVELTGNEFAAGDNRTEFIELADAESDFQAQATKTFNFDTSGDLEGWEVVRGTFTQTPPGAPGSTGFHLASSTAQNDACDEIRSRTIRLTAASTMSLQNQFSTEPPTPAFGDVFYDRANVGIFDLATEQRTTVAPDGGRVYNASGPHGACVTAGQPGWATDIPEEPGVPFAVSSWTAAAIPAAFEFPRLVQIDVAYGTDPLVSGAGFQFDQVTLTNFDLQVPDAQTNVCPPAPRPDLRVSNIQANNNKNAREGDKVTITATIRNDGTVGAPASTTRFILDGTTVLGSPATPAIPAGGSVNVSVQWDTRNTKGEHVITVTADANGVVAESNEGNNTSTLTVTVQGNKVKNSSFEQSNANGNGPDGWSGESTGAGTASWSQGGSDGSRSAATSGNGGSAATSGSPSWTSDAIPVAAGEVLTLVVSVDSLNASSAATAGLAYLGAAGQVLNSVTLLTAPLTTGGFTKLEQTVTIPAGVAQVRVKLVGFAATDVRTSGTVRFDQVGLFGN